MRLLISTPSTESHVDFLNLAIPAMLKQGRFTNIALPIPRELIPVVVKLSISSGKGPTVEFLRGSLGNAWLVTHEPLVSLIIRLYQEYPWVNVVSSSPSLNEQRRLSRIAVEMVALTARSAISRPENVKDRWIRLHEEAKAILDKKVKMPENTLIVSIGYVHYLRFRKYVDDVVMIGELKPTPTELFYLYRGDYDELFMEIVNWVVKYLGDIVPSSRNLTAAYRAILNDSNYLRFMYKVLSAMNIE